MYKHIYSTNSGLTDRYGNTLETIGDCVSEMNDLLDEIRALQKELHESRENHVTTCLDCKEAYETHKRYIAAMNAAREFGDAGDWQGARGALVDALANDSYQPTPGNGAAKQGEQPNEK